MPESKADIRWRKQRDREIKKRRREGDTVKGLAHDYGLSVTSIYRILRSR